MNAARGALLALALLLAGAQAPLRAQAGPATPIAARGPDPREQRAISVAERWLAHAERAGDARGIALALMALGDAQAARGERLDNSELIEDAAEAYDRALRSGARIDRGMALLRIGRIERRYGRRLGGIDGRGMLERAVYSLEAAVAALPRRSRPLDWAAAQSELGVALLEQLLNEPGMEMLSDEAAAERLVALARPVATLRLALEERRRDREPLDWARTRMALAQALGALGDETNDRAAMAESLAVQESGIAILRRVWSRSELDMALWRRDQARRQLERWSSR